MSKIYLASRYSRHEEMRRARSVLESNGHIVTSRWIDHHRDRNAVIGRIPEEASFTREKLSEDPSFCSSYALDDFEDILSCDILLSFNGGGRNGGRHVEFGLAYASGKRVVIIGERENVFHCLEGVGCYPSLEELLSK